VSRLVTSHFHLKIAERIGETDGIKALDRNGNALKKEKCLSWVVSVSRAYFTHQSCARVMTVESRVESRVIAFSRGRVQSQVASHQSRIRVFASHCQSFSSQVSSHYSAVGRVNVTKSTCRPTQDSRIALEMLCNGTMSEFIREKVSETR